MESRNMNPLNKHSQVISLKKENRLYLEKYWNLENSKMQI
jgi:hypothetical protein